MIAHVILFKPRPGLGAAERSALLQALKTASRDIPGIRSFRVGKRVLHGLPGYEQMMPEDFAFFVIIEVDDLEALKIYLAHPAHAAFGAHFTQSSAAALAYDYEVVDVADAMRLMEK
ncbi:MAG: Dabb family protein [Vicinamibacterales bacterium]